MAHTHSDRGNSATAAILGVLVAIVAILLIAVFAFGAFGWNDGDGALEGGGGVDETLPGTGTDGNGTGTGGGTGSPMNWHAGYDALVFV